MKYKVGDKVKYDGGDWWFYGTVSAVFEHSICPCYRLSVERMEKKSCKFSITQFEFEIEPDNEFDSVRDKRKWENSEVEYLEKYYGVLSNEDLSKVLQRSPQAVGEKWRLMKQVPEPAETPEPVKKQRRKRAVKLETEQEQDELAQKPKKEATQRKTTEAWDNNLESYRNGAKSNAISTWVSYNRKQYKTGVLSKDKLDKLMEINFPFEVVVKKTEKQEKPGRKRRSKQEKPETESQKLPKEPSKRKIGEAWDRNFELYRQGEKSNIISTWMAYNRKQYKAGNLSEEKFEKLMGVNFPFEVVVKKKADSWDKQLEEWKKGGRRSVPIQQWRQRSIRQYLEGKLSGDRISKLKEVGILK